MMRRHGVPHLFDPPRRGRIFRGTFQELNHKPDSTSSPAFVYFCGFWNRNFLTFSRSFCILVKDEQQKPEVVLMKCRSRSIWPHKEEMFLSNCVSHTHSVTSSCGFHTVKAVNCA